MEHLLCPEPVFEKRSISVSSRTSLVSTFVCVCVFGEGGRGVDLPSFMRRARRIHREISKGVLTWS